MLLLRAAVGSTDGKIRRIGRVLESSEGLSPIGPVSLRIGNESIRSETAAKAIHIVAAVDLLYGMGYVARDERSDDLVVYTVTAAGLAADSKRSDDR